MGPQIRSPLIHSIQKEFVLLESSPCPQSSIQDVRVNNLSRGCAWGCMGFGYSLWGALRDSTFCNLSPKCPGGGEASPGASGHRVQVGGGGGRRSTSPRSHPPRGTPWSSPAATATPPRNGSGGRRGTAPAGPPPGDGFGPSGGCRCGDGRGGGPGSMDCSAGGISFA